MDRVHVICKHLVEGKGDDGQAHCLRTNLISSSESAQLGSHTKDKEFLMGTLRAYNQGIEALRKHGKPPTITGYEVFLGAPSNLTTDSRTVSKLLDRAQADGRLVPLDLLPGPWQDARTQEEKIALIAQDQLAHQQGIHHQLYAHWQRKYGQRGFGSNIIVPTIVVHSEVNTAKPGSIPEVSGSGDRRLLSCRVILADERDVERVSRNHVRKEPNFGGFMDSVISTTDNDHWRAQREHLVEAFLPISALAKILPVSLQRAKFCAERLAQISDAGATPVDMSDFLLHEAQAQLQLALMGLPESEMNASNADIRKIFMQHPEAKPGRLSETMARFMQIAEEETTWSLPSDSCPVRGPLMRAVQTGSYHPSTAYGNMLIVLFAGHDTTGHTMTWFLFEMARNPALQREVQNELDQFFRSLGGRDPSYQDLSALKLLDRCITETLRLWPAVPNGTFRQLQFDDDVHGRDGQMVTLPKGTCINIANWSRHRNPKLWGDDAECFDPQRNFKDNEIVHIGQPLAATNPQSHRFSPFAHNPRSCLGKNFAQMEMRLILSYLLHRFTFELSSPYDSLHNISVASDSTNPYSFRGVNRGGTMGPLDIESAETSPDSGFRVAMKLQVNVRSA